MMAGSSGHVMALVSELGGLISDSCRRGFTAADR